MFPCDLYTLVQWCSTIWPCCPGEWYGAGPQAGLSPVLGLAPGTQHHPLLGPCTRIVLQEPNSASFCWDWASGPQHHLLPPLHTRIGLWGPGPPLLLLRSVPGFAPLPAPHTRIWPWGLAPPH